MNVKLEKQEKSKVVLEFTMPKEEFSNNLDKAFKKNSKYFKVPGFRTGKVPRNIVEKVYGEEVLYETVIDDNVNEAFEKAVKENNLEVVSKPELDVKQIGKDQDMIFTVTFFVKPEAVVEKYKGLEVEKIDTKLTKEEIDAFIEQERDKNAKVITVEDRALQQNDISTIDFEGFVDLVPFEGGKGENFELTIGSGQFIPGFEEQLIGMNINEEKEITVKFPKEYHSEALCGKDAMFKVKLISIKAKELPKLDDEFAKDVSEFETLEEYKKSVEEKLQKEKEAKAKAEKEIKILDKLVENTKVEIPESMLQDQIEQLSSQFEQNLAYQGLNLDTYCNYVGTDVSSFKETLKPQAKRDLTLNLAIEYIGKIEDVKVEEEDIDKKIIELNEQYGEKDATNLLKNENARNYMKEKLIQDKIMGLVIDNAVEKK